MFVVADVVRLPFGDHAFDVVFGSPPYVDCRLYLEDGQDLGISRECHDWVEWMLAVTTECLRVSKGAVVWVASGATRDRNYWPACEGLMYEWYRRGGHAYRPCYWNRAGIPGSGSDQWFRSDVEYVMCFKRPGPLPYANNIAMGAAPKWAPGGAMSYRLKNGTRVERGNVRREAVANGHGSIMRAREPDANGDSRRYMNYVPPDVANPGNLISIPVGGNRLGAKIAHESEAPFPERLAEFFLSSLCPPDGICLDPFSGSGTTVAVARKLGMRGIGADIRLSQCRLGRRRIRNVTPGFCFV